MRKVAHANKSDWPETDQVKAAEQMTMPTTSQEQNNEEKNEFDRVMRFWLHPP